MVSKINNVALAGIATLTLITGAVLYPTLPVHVASHWNAAGEVNGYMPKFWGVFLIPLMLIGLYIIYAVIPKVDPLKKNIESFRKQYDELWLMIFVFMAYVFALMLAWNLGFRFDFTIFMVPAIAVFFYIIGTLLEKSKRNWFVGIRTPWTLSSDRVWEKTHKLGGKLFRISAVISLLGLVVRDEGFILAVVIPLVAVAAITLVYSFVEYRRENEEQR